jgi:hypothetical protein
VSLGSVSLGTVSPGSVSLDSVSWLITVGWGAGTVNSLVEEVEEIEPTTPASMVLVACVTASVLPGATAKAPPMTGIATMMTAAMAVPENNERNTVCSPRSLCGSTAPRLFVSRYAR